VIGHIVFIHPNADNERGSILSELQSWISSSPRSRSSSLPSVFSFPSLPRSEFLELLRSTSVLVGNSSAGVYEAPLLGVPTVNIGNRQSGRSKGPSVLDCEPTSTSIVKSIESAKGMKVHPDQSPYHPKALMPSSSSSEETAGAEKRIVKILGEYQTTENCW
jgi:UDP-N-acetylglucosamine 2-epimerase